MSQSSLRNVIILVIAAKLFIIVESGATENVTLQTNSTLIEDVQHDPYQEMCRSHNGEYYREIRLSLVCCGNDTLKLPDVLLHNQYSNQAYAECSRNFKKDDKSDLPTAMWKAFLCKLNSKKVFKSNDKMTFDELLTFLMEFYPESVKTELKKQTEKCKGQCYYNAEHDVCNKPYGEVENHAEDVKKTKELGCPVVPGLKYSSSIEYCCKKRYTPYEILHFPGMIWDENMLQNIQNCDDSFSKRQMELTPPATAQVTTANPSADDMSFQMHTTWDLMCHSACDVEQKNYSLAMLKLDAAPSIKYYTDGYGRHMKDGLSTIIMRRVNKDKIFLVMDSDAEKSKPMSFTELASKFSKANEKDKIQYFCKFTDTISFEERRALHEYCFDEKYGNEWAETHHPYFVPQ